MSEAEKKQQLIDSILKKFDRLGEIRKRKEQSLSSAPPSREDSP